MNNDTKIEQAVAQMLDEPLNYNALIAHALGSTKAAIMLDYINARVAFQQPFPTNKDLQDNLHMSAHEVRTTCARLIDQGILLKSEGNYQLDDFFMETIFYLAEHRVIPPKRAASKSRINTSPAFSAGRVSLLKPSYAFALE